MANKNPKVDAYIAKSAPFAQPILQHLRKLLHEACPNIEENIKWSMPVFDYHGIMCNMAAFKQHCSFGFWKASVMKDADILQSKENREGMGHLGKITSLKDLPSDKKIISWIKEAMKLNETSVKVPKDKPKQARLPVENPEWLVKEIKKNKKAWGHFQAFPASGKKEYVEWITEAKTEATKQKRLEQALAWMEEGKPRNWKYMKQYN
jgi:uncharacterized protein YdeI (YjbR/CyaY-like superfamily)